ncbi:MAG: hypothetical protein HC822_07325 [Oscillochloris sp.]|nr:hypothetical protein [Oscillochloris sp.]
MFVGLFARRKAAWPWVVLTLACVVMALGPSLSLNGRVVFSPLPYAWMLDLPGMSFLRVPGRFMMVGFAGLAVAAAFGLQAITNRWPRYAQGIVAVAAVLLLLERWPLPPSSKLPPPVPDFYARIADSPDSYGVLDLPFRAPDQPFGYVINSAPYQYFQTIHNKGIVAGYLSRTYSRHPFFSGLMSGQLDRGPTDLSINGTPLSDALATRERLAALGYRYVVWHKTIYPSGNFDAQAMIAELFPDQQPLVDDGLVTVYSLESGSGVTASFGAGWWPAEANWRWGQSSAALKIYARESAQIHLDLTPAALYDPNAPGLLGIQGMLQVRVGDNPPIEVPVSVEQMVSIPLEVPAGESRIELSLASGNFFPPGDERRLSFAVRAINVQVTP